MHADTNNTQSGKNKQCIEQHKNFGRVGAVPHLCGFYLGICLTTEEKGQKNLSQGSRRVVAGTMKIHKHTIRKRRNSNKNIYLLTPWCRVLLEKLTGLQLVKKFPAFHGTRRFITALTSVRHLSLFWVSPI